MRLRTQLCIAGAAALVVVVLVTYATYRVSARGERALRLQAASQEVARNVASLLTLTQEFALRGQPRPAGQWKARHARLLATLDAAIADDNPPSPTLLELRNEAANLIGLFRRLEILPTGAGDAEFTERQRELILERLLVESQEVVETRYAWARLIERQHASQQRDARRLAIIGPAALFIVLAALAVMVRRRILLPLERLRAAAAEIEAGNLSARASLDQADELGETGRAIDKMASTLVGERQRLRLIVDNVPALISHIDLERRYTMVNKAYEDWDHGHLSDRVGSTVADVRGDKGYERLMPYLDRALTGEPVSFNVELPRGDEIRALRVTYVPERDAEDRVCGVFSMKSDVTDIKRAEQRLRLVMESSPLGIAIRSLERELLYANAAWYRIAGMAQVEGQVAVEPVVHPDDLAGVLADLQAAINGPATVSREFRYVHADGSIVWVQGFLTRLERGGRVEGVMAMLQDITQRRLDAQLAARSAALARSNEDLERFAYVASHDLQEPLRMVNSYGQLLLRRHGAQLDAEAQEFLAFIVDGGQRAQALIRDLLSMARLDSAARPVAPVDLEETLAAALRELRQVIAASGAHVTHDPLPTLLAEGRQIEQLFVNLIGNACKFKGDAVPRIHVGAVREDGSWHFTVSDNGVGIDPKHFERIFGMFQRLHLRHVYPGTGIGLAICKRVVERHEGRIWVESAPGDGATFHFVLPDGVPSDPVPARAHHAATAVQLP